MLHEWGLDNGRQTGLVEDAAFHSGKNMRPKTWIVFPGVSTDNVEVRRSTPVLPLPSLYNGEGYPNLHVI